MTELEVLTNIYNQLVFWFWVWLLFELLSWARRIVAKWKKGYGIDE